MSSPPPISSYLEGKWHPLVAEVMRLSVEQGIRPSRLLIDAGYSHNAYSDWRHGRVTPRLVTVIDLLDRLGYELKIVKKED